MLTIQFGQCGNQLGRDLFSRVCADLESPNTGVSHGANYEYVESTIEKWFDGMTERGRHLARAILVDTEEKVVNGMWKDPQASWTYRASNVVCQSGGGCANNWAYGYKISSQRLSDSMVSVTRREIEKLDRFQGFLLLLSSAGGTGSGVGSRMVETLRDEYETKSIVASIVLPFTFGEVSTQNYNTVLTLAEFSDRADFSVLFENQQMHAMSTSLLNNSNTMLCDMNNIISENLLAAFQPSDEARCNMNFLTSKVAAHPNFRFVTIKSAPHVPATSSPCVSNILVTRGKSVENDAIMLEDLQKRHLYPEWIASTESLTHLHQERKFLNRDKFLALITNNSEIHRPLDTYRGKSEMRRSHLCRRNTMRLSLVYLANLLRNCRP